MELATRQRLAILSVLAMVTVGAFAGAITLRVTTAHGSEREFHAANVESALLDELVRLADQGIVACAEVDSELLEGQILNHGLASANDLPPVARERARDVGLDTDRMGDHAATPGKIVLLSERIAPNRVAGHEVLRGVSLVLLQNDGPPEWTVAEVGLIQEGDC